MEFPMINTHNAHNEIKTDLQEAFTLLDLLERTDDDKILEMVANVSNEQPGIRPLNVLISTVRLNVARALGNLSYADSTRDPGVLFEYVFDHLKFPPAGVKTINYMNEIFGRLVKKIEVDQEEQAQEAKKDDADSLPEDKPEECLENQGSCDKWL